MNKYRNKHKGERCFIICNGPSLTTSDLAQLKDEITFGTNRIYLASFVPTYYAIEDHLVMEDNAAEIDALDCVKFVPDDLAEHLTRHAEYVNMRYEYSEGLPEFSKNLDVEVFSGGTVTYFCLQLAYWMGFSEVYLIGLDHSYVIPDGAEEVSHNIYLSNGSDPNHFDAEYFGNGKRFHTPNTKRMEKAYRKAKAAFRGRVIANASRKTKLNVFKKVSFDDLFTAS